MAARTVILVRHGKARARSQEVPDEERTLTKAGKRALRAWLPKSARLAKPLLREAAGAVEVWASPTARTRQTATEVARSFEKKSSRKIPVIERESLLAQDFAAFCAELAETSAACVIAVGHNPFMEDALACLCGARVEFATGAVAAVHLPRDPRDWMAMGGSALAASALGVVGAPLAVPSRQELVESVGVDAEKRSGDALNADVPGCVAAGSANAAGGRSAADVAEPPSGAREEARLLWFVQGPRSQRWKVRAEIEDAVRSWDETTEARIAAFLAAPDDPETMHRLRVSIRTLRSLLAFASPFMDKKRAKAVQRDLRSVVAETSRLREYDVLLAQVAELGMETGDLDAAVRAVRTAERDRVAAFLAGREAKRALGRVRASLRDFPWGEDAARWGIPPEDARARFDGMVRDVEAGFDTVDVADADAVHALRKDAKRVRYAAENLGGVLGAGAVDEARRMVGVQDRLGAVCDARVNVGIVCEFPTEGLSPEARRALGALLERNMAFEEEFLRGFECPGEAHGQTAAN